MASTDLGTVSTNNSKTAGTTMSFSNTSGAIIPAGTLLVFGFVCDNPASTTQPVLTVTGNNAGGTWTQPVTPRGQGVTTTAGAGIWTYALYCVTTVAVPVGGTIITIGLSASVVAKAGVIDAYSNVGAYKAGASAGTASGFSGTGSFVFGTGVAQTGDLAVAIFGQELASYVQDTSAVGGSWDTAVPSGTSGGSAVTNVVVGIQDKDLTSATNPGYINTNIAGDQAQIAFLFAAKVTNAAPVANAGPDQTVQRGATVTLTGAASTDDVGVSSYSWSQIGGAAVTLSSTSVVSPTFTAPAVTVATQYTFRLTVTDAGGLTGTDDVIITVRSNPPVAAAGNDQSVNAGATVNLSGSGSTDDGGISSYSWAQVAGTPTATITGATTVSPSFVAPTGASASLTFRLTVTDADGQTSTDDVVIFVNQAPVANAGNDQTVQVNGAVSLSGSASTDDVGVTAYSWAQVGGTPTVTLTNPNTVGPTFTAPASAATLTFRLTVTDAGGLTSTDDVVITVQAANLPPVAIAGADQLVSAGATVTLSGSGSSDDNGITSWLWEYMGPGYQFQDDFNRADGPLGSNWISVSVTPPTIANRKVVAPSAAAIISRYAKPCQSDDQFAQATWLGGTFNHVLVQSPGFDDTGGSTVIGSCYALRWTTATTISLAQKDVAGGGFTTLATATYTLVAGDVIRLEYVGGVLNGYVNGSLKVTFTPTNPLKGNPYVGFGLNTGSSGGLDMFDNWSGGDLISGPAAPTISGSTSSSATFTAPSTPGVYSFKLTVTDAGGLTSSDVVHVTVPSPAQSSVSRRGMWVGSVPTVTMVTGTPYNVTLPYHWAGDRLVVLEVGKYAAATLPMGVPSGWTVVASGSFATGQANGNDTGTLHWQLIAKDATTNAETLTITPGATVPNSVEIYAGAFPAPSGGWKDAISAIPRSALVDTDTTGVLASSPAAFGSSPGPGDMIIAVGTVPTDTATDPGTVTLTNAGLSGGTLAVRNFNQNPNGTDTTSTLAEWTGFTGVESGAYSASFGMTGATAMYGGVLLAALRVNPVVAAEFEGWGVPIS